MASIKILPALVPALLNGSFAIAQEPIPKTRYLTQPELNHVLNHNFASLVTGNSNSGEIANYASLDPVSGSFTLKGSLPVGTDKNGGMGKISYLGISIAGDLVNDNAASLFTNSSLNTNVGIQAQYNFRNVPAVYHYSYSTSDEAALRLKRLLLVRDSTEARQSISLNITAAPGRLKLLEKQQESDSLERIAKVHAYPAIMAYVDSLKHPANEAGRLLLKKAVDSLAAIDKSLQDLEESIGKNSRQQDSLRQVLADPIRIANYLYNQSDESYRRLMDSLTLGAPIKKWAINWFTVAGGIGRQKTYFFDGSLPFSSQIVPDKMTTGNISFAWNSYSTESLHGHTRFISLALGWKRENNAALFSTTEVDVTKNISNSTGDSAYTVTTKYNAFTDSLSTYNSWFLSGDFYFVFGKKAGGFHIFPEIDYRNDHKLIADLGAGWLICFLNSKKDQPAVNVEAFIHFRDLANQQTGNAGFWNRNEVGLSFTVPVNLFP